MIRFYVPPSIYVAVFALVYLAVLFLGFRVAREMKSRWTAILAMLVWALTTGAIIQSGASSDLWTIDATSKAGRFTPYDTAGNAVASANRAAIAETAGGLMQSGKDYKLSRTQRMSSTGGVHVAGDGSFMLWDTFEGTTRNLTQWVETIATATSAQTAAVGLTLNTGASVTSGQGVLESSHRQFPVVARAALAFRARMRVVGGTNCFQEWGFSDQTSVTAPAMTNGAFFRRDGAGSLQPILAFNGVEGAGATMTGPATTDYAFYEIFLEDDRATFQVTSATGVLISSQVMERGATGGSGTGVTTQARLFTVTQIPAFFRVYNSGTASTAPQIMVNMASVTFADGLSQRDHRIAMSGMGRNSSVSPTAFTQLATAANSANPGAVTISNTTCGVATLGGLVNMNSIAGASTTDLCLVGWQNPTPYTFVFTGVRIGPPQNLIAAVATTVTNFTTFAMAFNSSAASLATAAPYPPTRMVIGGVFKCPLALAVGDSCSGNDIVWTPGTPITVFPGRFLHVIVRVPLGTATATETFLFNIAIDGLFE